MASIEGETWAWFYGFIGSTIAIGAVYHILTEAPSHPLFHVFSYVLISFTASGIILYWAYRTHQDPFPARRYRRINLWMIVSGVFISGSSIVALYIGSQFLSRSEFLESSQLMLSVGLAVGLLIGLFEAESSENAEAAAMAESLEKERERLHLLNDLIRHYVLNGISVILGYAENLESSSTTEQSESASIIKERAERMANTVDNISVLTKMEWGEGEKVEADIGSVIRQKFSSHRHEELTLDLPDDLPAMMANDGYEGAMDLFMEACCKAARSVSSISIESDKKRGFISITVHPVDIPESLRGDLLEPVASGIGLELFLAKKALEPAIELEFTELEEDTIEFILRGEIVEHRP